MTTTAAPVRPVPLETVTPIRPSEAIRLGCLIRPVQTRSYMDDGPDKACALGAMAFGYGWSGGDNQKGFLYLYPRLPKHIPLDCGCRPLHHSPVGVVYHLNDIHDWSRERIADWLAEQGL